MVGLFGGLLFFVVCPKLKTAGDQWNNRIPLVVLSPISPCSSVGCCCCSCFLILDGEFLLPLHIFSSFLVCFRLPLVLFPVFGWWKLPTRGHYMKKAYCFSCVFSVACIVCVRIRACVAGYFPFFELVGTFVLFILYCASPSSLSTFHCQAMGKKSRFIYLPPSYRREGRGRRRGSHYCSRRIFLFLPRATDNIAKAPS